MASNVQGTATGRLTEDLGLHPASGRLARVTSRLAWRDLGLGSGHKRGVNAPTPRVVQLLHTTV
ncbi:hypothetical protein [Streptomyces canus]|uniref:hypothetical protein n=1 Tax=Streptomyces canus TaxID=58343 RepID=UPI002DDB4E13|nr:hypothetical protein [Streptomyces canus]WSD83585.1 hypothetical protein OG925_04450 [Streptomyces canus]